MAAWYTRSAADVASSLGVDTATGLSALHAQQRIVEHGPNELVQVGGRGLVAILWEQLSGAMVVLLVVAAGVSAVLHEYTDAVAIMAIVALNAALESVNLQVQESALTGESEAIEKQNDAILGADLPLGDRTNMTFMGTVVTYGHGQAVVVATGMNTELGQIANSLRIIVREPTPLQKRLANLGRALALVAIGIKRFRIMAKSWQ